MKLERYNPNSCCPKCGGVSVRSIYVGDATTDDTFSYRRKYSERGRWPLTEYLHRICSRCQYEWPQAVETAGARAALSGESGKDGG